MGEQNNNSIAHFAPGSLAKSNSSIGITNKIIKDSIHEFHGDFEGKKIWEVQTGIKSTIAAGLEYTDLLICNDLLLFYNKSFGFKLFNKYTGELIIEKSEKLSLIAIAKSNLSDDFLFSIYGHCYEQEGVTLKGYRAYLEKRSLPKLITITTASEILIDDVRGEENDYIVDLQITPDSKYVVTSCFYKPKEKMTISFWDYNSLVKVNTIEINSEKSIEKIKHTETENAIDWNFINNSVDSLSVKNKLVCIEGKYLFMVIKREKRISCHGFDDYKSIRFQSYWRLYFYDYSNSKIELSGEHKIYDTSTTYLSEKAEDLWMIKHYDNFFIKDMSEDELADSFRNWDDFFAHQLRIFNYNKKLNLISDFNYYGRIEFREIESGKTTQSFKPNASIQNENLKFSNNRNYVMERNATRIRIFDSKSFQLIIDYDISKDRPFEFATVEGGKKYSFENSNEIDERIISEEYCNYNYNTSIFDTNDKFIYSLCTNGNIHKWK